MLFVSDIIPCDVWIYYDWNPQRKYHVPVWEANNTISFSLFLFNLLYFLCFLCLFRLNQRIHLQKPTKRKSSTPKTGDFSILFQKKTSRDFCSPLQLTQCSPPFFSGETRLKAVLTWRMCSHPRCFQLPRLQVAACPWKVGSKTFLQQFSGAFFGGAEKGCELVA